MESVIRHLLLVAFWVLCWPGCGEQPESPYAKLPIWPMDNKLPLALEDKYVFWDPTTAEIVMSYPEGPNGVRVTHRYRPQNQVDPHILVEIAYQADGMYHYRYTLKNGVAARQSIDIWQIVGPGADSEIRVEHPFWAKARFAGTKAKQVALPAGTPDGEYLTWASGGKVIPPGGLATDFVIVSRYGPGFTTAYAVSGGYLSFRRDGPPEDVARQLAPLMKPEVNSRTTLTMGPRFSPAAARKVIANDYRLVLRQLAKEKPLSASSEFLRFALSLLDKCAALDASSCLDDQQAGFLKSRTSAVEHEIATALLLVLK